MYAFNNVRYELVGLDLNPFNYNCDQALMLLVSHLINHKKSFIKLLFIFFYVCLFPVVSRGKRVVHLSRREHFFSTHTMPQLLLLTPFMYTAPFTLSDPQSALQTLNTGIFPLLPLKARTSSLALRWLWERQHRTASPAEPARHRPLRRPARGNSGHNLQRILKCLLV